MFFLIFHIIILKIKNSNLLISPSEIAQKIRKKALVNVQWTFEIRPLIITELLEGFISEIFPKTPAEIHSDVSPGFSLGISEIPPEFHPQIPP